jgi:hypothetical protein
MTQIDKLLAGKPELQKRLINRAADPAVSGDMLLSEMRAAGVPARRSAVFLWRKSYRAAKRHRPNSLKGRVASALQTATPEQLDALKLTNKDTTATVFKLGRSRLYQIARALGFYSPA